MSLDSHSRRHSLEPPFAESPSSAPHPPTSSFSRHSTLLEQRRPTIAGHGQSHSWSGPGDTYAATRQQQEGYSFPSAFAPTLRQQQQQQPAHPLASLMLGGDIAPRTPINYNSYYTSASSSVAAAQHEPRTRDWGQGGGSAGVDGDTESHLFQSWDEESITMVKEEDEGQDWNEYRDEQRGGWDVPEVDEQQQQWETNGSEQQASGRAYDAYSTRQRFNNPYPSPYEPSAELPPLPALPSAYGTPPQYSSSFLPSSLPIGNQYTQNHTPFTPHYSSQVLSLSAPEARSYPSFAAFAEFSPTTTTAAQVLYDGRPNHQQQQQLDSAYRPTRPQHRPRAFTSTSAVGEQARFSLPC
ncbi:hypothetical protein BCR35DRAFT_328959 [Leucosporidium creatinivorum]|uniref:Uncharacterized protein n=1 Tax=Leucosporidium creatinivorum TaxID=106004 RepID=A0A1Y2G0V5_9BASI|nr:hypothetical protein BCR35DRAFT_328959 [Leucosporidium creatinivorum]